MNTNKGFGLVGIIIVLAIAVGGGVYVARQQSAKMELRNNVEIREQTSLRDLLGKNVRCSFTRESDLDTMNKTYGTVYIAGNNMSGEFTSETNAGTITSHMVRNGDYVYVWSSAIAGQGVKMKSDATVGSQAQNQGAVGWDDKLDYDCDDWAPENSKFEVPTDIKFNDLSSMMQATTSVNAGAAMNKCTACDMAPEAARAQCKMALGCK